MPSKNERVELEMKILKYRALARDAPDELTAQRIKELIAELEQSNARSTDKSTLGPRACIRNSGPKPRHACYSHRLDRRCQTVRKR
jgi:hypothetical protein